MSEYQYYEFVAVDRPLTLVQQGQLRALSTRAQISSSSFVNSYEWGDFKGDPQVLMERYFDAHLYLANWGTRRVMLRVPLGLLDLDTASGYCVGDSAGAWATREHVILNLSSEDEDGDWEHDGQGLLASIVPARTELAAADLRLLYLAWLLCVQAREVDEDEPEPPVPAGLGQLSGPQRALADFLRLDPDLLAAAARASAPLTAKQPSGVALARWVRRLPADDKDSALVRMLRGDPTANTELLRRYRTETGAGPTDTEGNRTAGELLAAAEQSWAARQRAAEQRAAAERARQEQAAAAARQQRLHVLAAEGEQAWQRVETMIASKKPKGYDAAVALLTDLKAVADGENGTTAFIRRVRRLRQEHARKPSLIDRLDRARLG